MLNILTKGAPIALATIAAWSTYGCIAERIDGGTGTAGEELKFGSLADPVQTGVPVVWHLSKPASSPGVFIAKSEGTAVLLSDRWALTAKHVLELMKFNDDDPKQNDKVSLALGDPQFATTQVREIDGRRVFFHPTRDVVVFRLKDPFTNLPAGATHTISDLTRAQIVAQNPLLQCFGYGQSQPLVLKRSSYKPLITDLADPFWIDLGPIAATDFEKGDSGGPCLDGLGKIATIHSAIQLLPARTFEESAPGFRQFAVDVTTALITAHGDVNANGKEEFVFIKTTNVGGVDLYDIKVLWDDGTSVSLTTPLKVIAGAIDKLLLVLGNFNGDKKVVGPQTFDYDDLVFGLGNKFVYYRGSDLGLVAQSDFDLIDSAVTYKDMNTRDFNGDGKTDLELVRDDKFSQRDIYFGTANGLAKGEGFIATPVDDPGEGRFSMITGPQEFTYPVPQHDFLLWIPKSEALTRVQVFDGYFGSRYDFGAGRACYRLYASKLGKDDPADPSVKLFKTVDSVSLAAHEWDTIYDGPHSPDAINGSTAENYVYLLRAQVGGCDSTPQLSGANAFMVRANGSVGAFDGGIYARDRSGPAAVADSGFLGVLPDTTYDGTFTFYYESGIASDKLYLRDADADNSKDEDHPGFEIIKSPVTYSMAGPTGTIITNGNPSGQYSPFAGQPKDVEEFEVSPFSVGIWTQTWNTLLQGNMVFAGSLVKGSPEIPIPRLTRPTPLPRISCARDRIWWVSEGDIGSALPLTIGAGVYVTQIDSTEAAETAMSAASASLGGGDSKKTSVCHTPDSKPAGLLQVGAAAVPAHAAHGDDTTGPSAHMALVGELVAAKLNLYRASLVGEPILEAHIYGRVVLVSDLLASADTYVRLGNDICNQSPTYWVGVAETTRLLRALNAAELSYLGPRTYAPPALTSGGTQAGLSFLGL